MIIYNVWVYDFGKGIMPNYLKNLNFITWIAKHYDNKPKNMKRNVRELMLDLNKKAVKKIFGLRSDNLNSI